MAKKRFSAEQMLNYRPPAPQTFAPFVHHLDEIMPMQ